MALHDGDRVQTIFSRLMGRKVLILGNHDYQRQNRIHPVIASLAWDQPPTQQLEITDDGERIFLCHYPCRTWPGILKGAWHFYGHAHGEMPTITAPGMSESTVRTHISGRVLSGS